MSIITSNLCIQYVIMLYNTRLTGLPFFLPLTGLWFVDEPQNENFEKAKCQYICGGSIFCQQAKSDLAVRFQLKCHS